MPRLREFRWDSWADWATTRILKAAPPRVAVDTETTGVGFYDEPFAATLTWRDPDGSLVSGYYDLESEGRQHRIEMLAAALSSVPSWIGHNIKFDLQKLLLTGVLNWPLIEAAEIHDTQTQYTLLDENDRKGLKYLAVKVLKYDDTIEVEYKSGAKKGQKRRVPKEEYRLNEARRKLGLKKEDGYHLLPRQLLIPYALRDTEFTLRLHEILTKRLERLNDLQILQLYADAMQLKRVLLRMEADGLRLDNEYLDRTTSAYGVKVMESWNRVVELTGKPDLNPQSPAQVTQAFRDRGIYLETTEAAELKKLDDPLAGALMDYRDVKKMHATYFQGMQRERRDDLIHPNFNDDAARTGRMSSSSAKE